MRTPRAALWAVIGVALWAVTGSGRPAAAAVAMPPGSNNNKWRPEWARTWSWVQQAQNSDAGLSQSECTICNEYYNGRGGKGVPFGCRKASIEKHAEADYHKIADDSLTANKKAEKEARAGELMHAARDVRPCTVREVPPAPLLCRVRGGEGLCVRG
jgi:hypothetical protein